MELTASTRQAVARARQQGVKVTLATGRSFHSAKRYADQLKLDIPLICANGGTIRHRGGEIHSVNNFNKNVLPLLHEMQTSSIYVQVYHNNGIYSSSRIASLSAWIEMACANKYKPRHLAYSIREYLRSKVKKVPDLVKVVGKGGFTGHKIFSTGASQALDGFQSRAAELGLSVSYYPGTRTQMYLEITPPGISKGWALAKLAENLKIDMSAVAAIGDNMNDRTMIETAGLGIVMGNGPQNLKQLAGEITLSNDEDGVAAAINNLILPADLSFQVV